MVAPKTYYTETGLTVRVNEDIAEIALSDIEDFDGWFRVCDPASFFDDPLRDTRAQLIGKTVQCGDALIVIEDRFGYVRHLAPLSGTITKILCQEPTDFYEEPSSGDLLQIRLSQIDELEQLSDRPLSIPSKSERGLKTSFQNEPLRQYPSILKSLGGTGSRIFHIQKIGKTFRIAECSDWNFEQTLTREDLIRLSDELRRLADLTEVDPHFLRQYAED